MEIMQSELLKQGIDEVYTPDGNQLVLFDDDNSFIQYCLWYTDDVKAITNHVFFKGVKLDAGDDLFKRAFLNRFLSHEIGYQTMERFSSVLISCLLKWLPQLNIFFSDLDKYLEAYSESQGDSKSAGTHDNRMLESTLPQSDVNLDVFDDQLTYGDNNSISKQRDENQSTNNNQSKQYSYQTLEQFLNNQFLENCFRDIERKCFMKVW